MHYWPFTSRIVARKSTIPLYNQIWMVFGVVKTTKQLASTGQKPPHKGLGGTMDHIRIADPYGDTEDSLASAMPNSASAAERSSDCLMPLSERLQGRDDRPDTLQSGRSR